jgi:Type II secretion system (T2SS), protein G
MLATYKKRCVFRGLEFLLVAFAVVAAAFLFAEFTTAKKEERATMELKRIEAAMLAYGKKNGHFPESLGLLCDKQPNGGDALLNEPEIIDPWGNQYAISTTLAGRIWISSNGPPGRNKPIHMMISVR